MSVSFGTGGASPQIVALTRDFGLARAKKKQKDRKKRKRKRNKEKENKFSFSPLLRYVSIVFNLKSPIIFLAVE